MYAASYRLLIVRYPSGLLSVRRRCLVEMSMANIHMCHSLVEMRHTPPTPSRDASVSPIQVGSLGRISRRRVGISARNAIRCRHKFSLSWTTMVMLTCWSIANHSVWQS